MHGTNIKIQHAYCGKCRLKITQNHSLINHCIALKIFPLTHILSMA